MTTAILYAAFTLAVPLGTIAGFTTWLLLHYGRIHGYAKIRAQVLAGEVWPRGYLATIPEDYRLRRRMERLRYVAYRTAVVREAA